MSAERVKPKKETWAALSDPRMTLVRGIPRRQALRSGKLVDAWGHTPPEPPALSRNAWNERFIPLEIGAFTTEIERWRKVYKDIVHARKEDKEDEDKTRERYRDKHGHRVHLAKTMTVPTLEVLRTRLNSKNMTDFEAAMLGATCLYGVKDEGRKDEEEMIDKLGLKFFEKAYVINPLEPSFPLGLAIEYERLMEKYRLKPKSPSPMLFRVAGEEEFTVPELVANVREWIENYTEDVVGKGKILGREEQNMLRAKLEGDHRYHVYVVKQENKPIHRELRYIFEQNEEASAYFLYRNVALPALRNSWKRERKLNQVLGFEVLKECAKRAGDNPKNHRDFKGFYDLVLVIEYINKWVERASELKKQGFKAETEPQILRRVKNMFLTAYLNYRNRYTSEIPR